MVKKESMLNQTQILFTSDMHVAVGVVVANATKDKNNMLKAGSPLSGDLKARTTPFVAAAEGKEAVGVLLHDVKFEGEEDANATLLISGFVNMDRLDEATAKLITEDVIASLKGNVTFLK